jgi:hypothetical protein
MKRILFTITLIFIFVHISNIANAQLDSTVRLCQTHINLPYIS